MTFGMPARVMTLPSMKPGATDIEFSINSAPSGIRAMRRRAGCHFHPALLIVGQEERERPRVDIDFHAERLGDRSRR